jgi:hypothetical protein
VPQKSRSGEILDGMHLDSAVPQDSSTHLARRLAAVDQKNSLPKKIVTATT